MKNAADMHCVSVIVADAVQSVPDLDLFLMCHHNICFVMQLKILQSILNVCACRLLLKCNLS